MSAGSAPPVAGFQYKGQLASGPLAWEPAPRADVHQLARLRQALGKIHCRTRMTHQGDLSREI